MSFFEHEYLRPKVKGTIKRVKNQNIFEFFRAWVSKTEGQKNGYKVGINEPYSNSETPDCPFLYQSMMLEVNKKAYMQPDSLRLKQPDFTKSSVRDLMNRLLAEFL